MLSKRHSIKHFFRYYFKSKTYNSIPDGVIKAFLTNCLELPINDSKKYEIEKIRKKLFNSDLEVDVIDFGAGSKSLKTRNRKVSDIAKTSVSPSFQCEFLAKICQNYSPKTRLEIGTSLGISTLYQAMDGRFDQFYSLEGSPQIAKLAKENLQKLNLEVQLLVGEFNDTLPQVFNTIETLDYALIDGNHRKAATLAYFNMCLTKTNEQSILVFDDIYWSEEMTEAWEIIKKDPRVSYTIDVYFFGLVFFNKNKSDEKNYVVIPTKYKFWKK